MKNKAARSPRGRTAFAGIEPVGVRARSS
ncbi:MAG: hypothetical protein RLY47_190, partial [Candidatus Parcubacteria bacterium]